MTPAVIAAALSALFLFAIIVQQRTMGRVGKSQEMRWWRRGFWQ